MNYIYQKLKYNLYLALYPQCANILSFVSVMNVLFTELSMGLLTTTNPDTCLRTTVLVSYMP